MADNLIHHLLPHQGCVITRTPDGVDIAGSAMNWVMSAGVATNEWHAIEWEIRLDRMRVIVDGEIRYDGQGDYSGIESTPSVGPCFGSAISIREFSITPLP